MGSGTGRVESINASRGGVPKSGVFEGLITEQGLDGDRQQNRRVHGGPDRAVCLFSEELYAELRDETGIELIHGAVGENFTTRGINLNGLSKGDRLRIGESCVIEITNVRVPCSTLRVP